MMLDEEKYSTLCMFVNSKQEQEHCKSYIFLVLLKETAIELNLMSLVMLPVRHKYVTVWV